MIPVRHILLAVATVAIFGPAVAQKSEVPKPVMDGQLWLSAGADFKPFRKKSGAVSQPRFFRNLRMKGELDVRLDENATHAKQVNLNAGAKYPVTSFMNVGAEYRYSIRPEQMNRNRIDLQLWLKWKKDRTSLDYRFEYEHAFIPVENLRTALRNRLTVEYNIPKWKPDPHISAESFTGLHYTGNRLVGMRYELGTEVNLDKKKDRTLGLAVRYDQELNIARPEHAWILVIAFEHSFRKK